VPAPRATGLPVPAAFGLGGNLGAVREVLTDALLRLAEALGPLAIAPLFRTAPVSPLTQPAFLNTAAVATTAWAPEELLALAGELEARAGRRPGPRWGPRPLDVDLLVHGATVRHDPRLTLPHPRLRERAFVLVPLAAVAPDLPIPPDAATPRELLARLGPLGGVERVAWGAAAARRLGLSPAVAGDGG
jgi:2-amino-4-hydroxy-6-hydroxymethyldihydropteridine diphosphokinase